MSLRAVDHAAAAAAWDGSAGEVSHPAYESEERRFLPVLVFAAALSIELRAFVRNLGAIVRWRWSPFWCPRCWWG